MKFSILRRKKERDKERDELLLRIAMQDVEIARYKTLADDYKDMVKSYEEIVDSYHSREAKRTEKIQKLEKEIWELKLQIPSKFPVGEIMRACADAAWEGTPSARKFQSVDGKVQLFFEGTVYEPSYECFTAGCCVYFLEEGMDKKKSLYAVDDRCVEAYRKEVVTNGSIDEIKNYILSKNTAFEEVL